MVGCKNAHSTGEPTPEKHTIDTEGAPELVIRDRLSRTYVKMNTNVTAAGGPPPGVGNESTSVRDAISPLLFAFLPFYIRRNDYRAATSTSPSSRSVDGIDRENVHVRLFPSTHALVYTAKRHDGIAFKNNDIERDTTATPWSTSRVSCFLQEAVYIPRGLVNRAKLRL